jgi:acyl-CoA thioester hydrolase
MAQIFEYPLQIRERHLDTFGHVNNAVYLEIFEEARWDIINKRGYGLKRIRETGHGPVILEVNLKFLKELALGQKVTLRTEAVSYVGKIAQLKQWIVDESETVYAEALFTMGLFDLRSRKLIEPTPEWLSAIGQT